MIIKGQKNTELILYFVLWTLLFVAPVLNMYISEFFTSPSDDSFPLSYSSNEPIPRSSEEWQGVFIAWKLLAMFFVTFIIHNFFIAPLLVYRNRKWGYGIGVIALLACFSMYQIMLRPHHHEPRDREREQFGEFDKRTGEPPLNERGMGHRPNDEAIFHSPHSPRPMIKDDEPDKPKDISNEPPRAFGGQDSVAFIIMSLLLGLNIGTKYFFKSLDYRKRMKELERENLMNQLNYLKYQINPHFFMNTLNNIHALVLIDPETANHMIETLSKLMRYVLYDGNRSLAPLKKELAFVENYVELMRMRYTDKVRISMDITDNVPNINVPSLLFATFIENAFKHGVSYERQSFIEITINESANSGVCFTCRNSKLPEKENTHGGVGLANARKRLQLIYGKHFTLDITPSEREYCVTLKLPAKK